jgi:hypothetical protein
MLMGKIVTNLRFTRGGTEENYENSQSGRYSNRHLTEWILVALSAARF